MAKTDAETNGSSVKETSSSRTAETEMTDPRPSDISATAASKSAEKSKDILTITVFKKLKIRICKPLIPLKIALFLWYGAASALAIFLMVFYKKKGITLAELSTIYVITPVVQLLGPTISGIIADKIGRSKPVLVANIVLTNLIVAGMLLSPSLHRPACGAPGRVNLSCDALGFGNATLQQDCGAARGAVQLVSCNLTCSRNVNTDGCEGDGLVCKVLEQDVAGNFNATVHLNETGDSRPGCHRRFTNVTFGNASYSWCADPDATSCDVSCEEGCATDVDVDGGGRSGILVLNTVLLVLFYTAYSNTYRFMDVTTMFLVGEHSCDFGVQRAFAVVGILVFSPVSGLIVDATSAADGAQKNYESALFLFIGTSVLLLAVVHRLEVRIRPPGQNMWRKSLLLLRNPDAVAFALVLVVLGTAWSFNKNFLFWYLEGMGSPSYLLGLVNSISALYGLPFLFVAQWWVKKIGTTRIFLLGLLGYVTSGIGYSLIYDPRLALLIELSNVFTYHLLWVAVVVYSHSIAPEGLVATVISTAGGIHFSIGRGTGGLIGGRVMSAFGGRVAFRVIALMCFVSGVLYAIYLFIRKLWQRKSKSLGLNDGTPNAAFETGDTAQESYVLKNKS